MEASRHIQMHPAATTRQQQPPQCTNPESCFQSQHDKTNLSRRSIDWRDSGIVIDEDNHLFHSFENVSNFDTRSSIRSECSLDNLQLQGPTRTSSAGLGDLTDFPGQTQFATSQDEDGDTILHLAVVGFTLDRARDLISVCELNSINNMMQTPLHVAILANRPEMVELLVKADAQLDIHDRRGNTPLHLACQKGLVEIVEIILSAIATNKSGACEGELTHEQALNMCNFDGLTCLHLAAMNNQTKMIEMLVSKYHAKSTVRDSKSGETILHIAIRQFNAKLVAFILNLNQHCNVADFSGRAPLDTIHVLQESSSPSRDQLLALNRIKQLIENSIKECSERGGCCFGYQERRINSIDLSDSASSSSSSDYSDSDYEMN